MSQPVTIVWTIIIIIKIITPVCLKVMGAILAGVLVVVVQTNVEDANKDMD